MQIVFSRVSVSRSVRAIRFEADGSVKLVQLPNPQSGPEDVVVQVLAAGVCHTDLHPPDEGKAGEWGPPPPGHGILGPVSKNRPAGERPPGAAPARAHSRHTAGPCRPPRP